jgi:hypothetical protein
MKAILYKTPSGYRGKVDNPVFDDFPPCRIPLWLERRVTVNETLKEIKGEFMITKVVWAKAPGGGFDPTKTVAYIVAPVTASDKLIEHEGFECWGSMCATTANVKESHEWVSPGLMNGLLYEAFNAGIKHGKPSEPRIPGTAYAKEHKGALRVYGIPSERELSHWVRYNHPSFLQYIKDARNWQISQDIAKEMP